MKAVLRNYRQSPRKVRNVANLVRGRSVEEADRLLQFTVRRAGVPLRRLLKSAVANRGASTLAPNEELVVQEIGVDKGRVMRRFRPGAHGRAYPVRKKSSHVKIVLGVRPVKRSKAKATKAEK